MHTYNVKDEVGYIQLCLIFGYITKTGLDYVHCTNTGKIMQNL